MNDKQQDDHSIWLRISSCLDKDECHRIWHSIFGDESPRTLSNRMGFPPLIEGDVFCDDPQWLEQCEIVRKTIAEEWAQLRTFDDDSYFDHLDRAVEACMSVIYAAEYSSSGSDTTLNIPPNKQQLTLQHKEIQMEQDTKILTSEQRVMDIELWQGPTSVQSVVDETTLPPTHKRIRMAQPPVGRCEAYELRIQTPNGWYWFTVSDDGYLRLNTHNHTLVAPADEGDHGQFSYELRQPSEGD